MDLLIRGAACIFLGLGLFTTVIGAITTALCIWALFWGHTNLPVVQVAILFLGVAVVILGPGAFSIDALLFGRRCVIT